MPLAINVEIALRRLIREIETGDYTDPGGNHLNQDRRLRQAQTLLDVHDVLSGGPLDLGDGSVEAALGVLVEECARVEYRDHANAPLVTSPAYLEAVSLVGPDQRAD